MRGEVGTVEELLARLASRSHGIVTRKHLLGVGLTGDQIWRRVRNGSLIEQYRGVYRVGHAAPSTEADYLAAVRACGEDAVLSGLAAAWLWGLIKGSPPTPEVTSPGFHKLDGLISHRRPNLDRRDRGSCRGVPVLTVAAMIVDVAAVLDRAGLARICHEAGVRYRTTPRQVGQALVRRPKARGSRGLRAVLVGDEPALLSRLERRFRDLLIDEGLPLPETNRRAGTRRVDCRWEGHGLTVELDSYRFHNSRHSWEADRQREREARARGDEHRRYTWRDVAEQPGPMLAELRRLLLRPAITAGSTSR
jgi:hypothetical protein